MRDVQRAKEGLLGWADRRDAGDRLGRVQPHAVMLDSAQALQGSLRRDPGMGGTQALAHHPVEDQGDEADRGVRPDALGQAVIHRGLGK